MPLPLARGLGVAGSSLRALPDHLVHQALEQSTLRPVLTPKPRRPRMIGHRIMEVESAEPAHARMYLDLVARLPFAQVVSLRSYSTPSIIIRRASSGSMLGRRRFRWIATQHPRQSTCQRQRDYSMDFPSPTHVLDSVTHPVRSPPSRTRLRTHRHSHTSRCGHSGIRPPGGNDRRSEMPGRLKGWYLTGGESCSPGPLPQRPGDGVPSSG